LDRSAILTLVQVWDYAYLNT